jgi:hypothetical protein
MDVKSVISIKLVEKFYCILTIIYNHSLINNKKVIKKTFFIYYTH